MARVYGDKPTEAPDICPVTGRPYWLVKLGELNYLNGPSVTPFPTGTAAWRFATNHVGPRSVTIIDYEGNVYAHWKKKFHRE